MQFIQNNNYYHYFVLTDTKVEFPEGIALGCLVNWPATSYNNLNIPLHGVVNNSNADSCRVARALIIIIY